MNAANTRHEGTYDHYTNPTYLAQCERKYPEMMKLIESHFDKGMTMGDMYRMIRVKCWNMKKERACAPKGWRARSKFIHERMKQYEAEQGFAQRPYKNCWNTPNFEYERWDQQVYQRALRDWDEHAQELDTSARYASSSDKERFDFVMTPLLSQKYTSNGGLKDALCKMWGRLNSSLRAKFNEPTPPAQETLISVLVDAFSV